MHAKDAQRIIGDHIDNIDDYELVLVGPNLNHGWFTHECKSTEITEVTIQFHKDLFDDKLLRKNHYGLCAACLRMQRMLSCSRRKRPGNWRPACCPSKSDTTFHKGLFNYTSRRIEKAFEYMNNNYDKQVSLTDVAKLVTEISYKCGFNNISNFNRIFKKKRAVRLRVSGRVCRGAGHSYNAFRGKPKKETDILPEHIGLMLAAPVKCLFITIP